MTTYALGLLKSLVFALVVGFSVSACSSTLAPEDDATTEYVFEQADADQQLPKDEKTRVSDRSDD